MKRILVAACMSALCGCSTVAGFKNAPGGAIGAVQAADDALASRSGVPPEVTARIRKALGIVDARALPNASRVLPEGYTWRQDILDKDGKVVDVSSFRKGLPYIVPDGAGPEVTVTAADLLGASGAPAPNLDALISQVLEAVAKDPTLLESVAEPEL